jgi:hypothetical protein
VFIFIAHTVVCSVDCCFVEAKLHFDHFHSFKFDMCVSSVSEEFEHLFSSATGAHKYVKHFLYKIVNVKFTNSMQFNVELVNSFSLTFKIIFVVYEWDETQLEVFLHFKIPIHGSVTVENRTLNRSPHETPNKFLLFILISLPIKLFYFSLKAFCMWNNKNCA